MKKIKNVILMIVIGLLFLFVVANSSSMNAEINSYFELSKAVNSKSNIADGYKDIILFKDRIYAIGSDERIDLISEAGEKVSINNSDNSKLNCGIGNEELIIVCGDNGTILYSHDGKNFLNAESNTNKSIYGITFKNGIYYAGSETGVILVSKNGKEWFNNQIEAKGNILSLSSNNSLIIGVTDQGEIIKSSDGITWEIKDYNKEYAGYNEFSNFRKVLATEDMITIIGTHEDGTPSLLFSTSGTIWSERKPIYYDVDGILRYLNSQPNDITYDFHNKQFIIVCDNGELLSLPSCSKCNKYVKINEAKLDAIIIHEDKLVIAGSNYSLIIESLMNFDGILY